MRDEVKCDFKMGGRPKRDEGLEKKIVVIGNSGRQVSACVCIGIDCGL